MESVLEPKAFLKEFKIVSSSLLKLSYYSGQKCESCCCVFTESCQIGFKDLDMDIDKYSDR